MLKHKPISSVTDIGLRETGQGLFTGMGSDGGPETDSCKAYVNELASRGDKFLPLALDLLGELKVFRIANISWLIHGSKLDDAVFKSLPRW